MHRFYAPDIEKELRLPEEEARHCRRVLRLRDGERIEAVDGRGNLYLCEIKGAGSDKGMCGGNIGENHRSATLGMPDNGGRGADEKSRPFRMDDGKVDGNGRRPHCPFVMPLFRAADAETDRLRKIMVSAMKQSLKATLPQLDELTPVEDVIASAGEGQRFVAYCDREIPRLEFVRECEKGSDVVVLIGPEGDFSKEEITSALAAGFRPVSLGNSRLRTETAGVFACAAIHVINQL